MGISKFQPFMNSQSKRSHNAVEGVYSFKKKEIFAFLIPGRPEIMKELDNSIGSKRIGGHMKRTILYLLIVSIIAVIAVKGLNGVPQKEGLMDKDNYGKVVGRIVDEDTGEPVKEKFTLYIYDSRSDENAFYINEVIQTDTQGNFSVELIPFVYYIMLVPNNDDSRYCELPAPYKLEEKKRYTVKVEKGKITIVQLRALIGGKIKIFTADLANTKINPRELFDQKFNLKVSARSSMDSANARRDDLNDGVLTLGRLYPGVFSVEVEFDGLGYPPVKKENILVEKGKTTEVLVNIDLNDNTGIEGIITDANGVIVGENASVGFSHRDSEMEIDFGAYANKDGYYILKGMPEGFYYVSYNYETKTGLLCFDYGIVEIKKNNILHLDIQYPETKYEMENESK